MDTAASQKLSEAILGFCDSQTFSDPVTERWLADLRDCASLIESQDVDAAIAAWGVANRNLSDCVPWTDDILRGFQSLIRDIRILRGTHSEIPTAFTR
ncbi:hypothetical protein RE6C_05936 [Rhodopirellula europaea 6C]|uniref:Uncharacterized protein n=1 Tax=Rhodopirellula europaea 6C TaxID=1263867 RepID=M2AKV4_9BACT|nr:hypothetical protein RE6C_05936 [Rhodopirellula europaea 6C]